MLNNPFDSNSIYLNSIQMISIKNTSFNNKLQAFIYSSNSNIYLNMFNISNMYCIGEKFECLGYFMKTTVIIKNSMFSNIFSYGRKNILNMINSVFVIKNTTFEILNSENSDVVMNFLNCKISIDNALFMNYSKGLMHLFQGNISIFNSKFLNVANFNFEENSLFSTIKCEFSTINLFNSCFNNNITNGGVFNIFYYFTVFYKY